MDEHVDETGNGKNVVSTRRKRQRVQKAGAKVEINPFALEIGQRLRAARTKAGFETIEEAADALGWPRQSLASYENGYAVIALDRLREAIVLFKAHPALILFGSDEKTTETGLSMLPDDVRPQMFLMYQYPELSEMVIAFQSLPQAQLQEASRLGAMLADVPAEELGTVKALVEKFVVPKKRKYERRKGATEE